MRIDVYSIEHCRGLLSPGNGETYFDGPQHAHYEFKVRLISFRVKSGRDWQPKAVVWILEWPDRFVVQTFV